MFNYSFYFSVRASFGKDIKANAVHGSSDVNRAQEEMKLVFGDVQFNADGTVKSKTMELYLICSII